MNSPSGKHIGALPSQQPPDWWNISSPCRPRSSSISASAASVATTWATVSGLVSVMKIPSWLQRGAARAAPPCAISEEPERLVAVADQQGLGLLIVVQHHLVVLAPDARLLVAAERRMRRIGVIAVRPDPAGLDAAAHAEGGVHVARPHARAQPVERVVGDRQRLFLVLERRHRNHRAEDLLLEDAHLVVALEDGRLDVEAAFEVVLEQVAFAADQALGALLAAEVEVAEDLLELLARRLRADHGRRVERVALLDR